MTRDEEAFAQRHRVERRVGARPDVEILAVLRTFVEGPMDKAGWDEWWAGNSELVAREVSRRDYLGLKFKPMEFAREMLEDFGVEFEADWTRCGICGVTLSRRVFEGSTTDESRNQVREKWKYNPVACRHAAGVIVDPYIPPEKEDFDRSKVCSVLVNGGSSLSRVVGFFNFYVDGNTVYIVEEWRHRFSEQDLWVEPGEHRIVAREYEVHKPDRKESNTLWFTAVGGGTVRFELREVEGELVLREIG